jgi:hypothetical protein
MRAAGARRNGPRRSGAHLRAHRTFAPAESSLEDAVHDSFRGGVPAGRVPRCRDASQSGTHSGAAHRPGGGTAEGAAARTLHARHSAAAKRTHRATRRFAQGELRRARGGCQGGSIGEPPPACLLAMRTAQPRRCGCSAAVSHVQQRVEQRVEDALSSHMCTRIGSSVFIFTEADPRVNVASVRPQLYAEHVGFGGLLQISGLGFGDGRGSLSNSRSGWAERYTARCSSTAREPAR